jgi:hypothetical protein
MTGAIRRAQVLDLEVGVNPLDTVRSALTRIQLEGLSKASSFGELL